MPEASLDVVRSEQTAESQRVEPHSVEAEQAVLGGLMLDNQRLDAVLEILAEEDFYLPGHRLIFRTMLALAEADQPLDVLTLSEDLHNRGELDQAGGLGHLTELAANTPSASNILAYARIVRERSTLRQLIKVAAKIETASRSPGGLDSDDLLQMAERLVTKIAEERPKEGGLTEVNRLIKATVERIDELFRSDSAITGVSSGIHGLDDKTSGWQPGELIVLAARPSMGKTALALNFVETAIFTQTKPVLVFSMEMPSSALIMRMLSSVGRIDQGRLRNGKLTEEDWPKLSAAVTKLKDKPLFIDDTPGLTPQELRARVRRIAREHGNPGLVMVDYLQLMQVAGSREGRTQEISEISRSMKALAKEFDCPVIALSQLNRGVEQRPNKRPMNSDLRECVTGDTLVSLADGRRVPVRDLEGQTPDVLALDTSGRLLKAQASQVWRVGCKPVKRVYLASGRSLKATPEHRLMADMEWKTIAELKPGDRLALARKLPEPQAPLAMPDNRVLLLAHLIGDGSYLKGQPLRYTTNSEESSQAVTRAAVDEFGVTVNRHQYRDASWHQLVFSGNGNRWRPAGINLWLRELGIFNQRSHEKCIPECVFSLSDRQIALFLKHLWAADGTIYTRPEGSRGSHVIHYSTNSPALARGVAALLQRLGIIARAQGQQKQHYRPGYLVCVTGADMQRLFLQQIGGFGPRAQQASMLAQRLSLVAANTNVDTLPLAVFSRVKEVMRDQGISQRAMASMRGTSYGGSSHFRFAPSRATLASYAGLLQDEELAQVADSDLFWDKVVRIEDAGEEEVFDLSVPVYESWLADGIVSHNSGAIEQDADIILFIYRDEYYNEDSPEKGVAELIIGKQRSGETGTCHAAFIGKYTRFDNLAPEYFQQQD